METERLLLRRIEDTDDKDIFELAKDPDIGPRCGWNPHKDIEETRFVIKNVLTGPECYAICFKDEGKIIGVIELMLNGGSINSGHEDECELGYWLGRQYWGKGIMPEAAEEMIRHGFEDLGMNRIWCGYYDGNSQSARVQEKCGFKYQYSEDRYVALMEENRTDHVNLLTREEWEKNR